MENWYLTAEVDKLEKEASLKEGLIISLITLLSGTAAWFEAGAIRNYLEEKNIAQESFTEVVNNLNHTSKPLEEMDKSDILLANDNIHDYPSQEPVFDNDYFSPKKETTKNPVNPVNPVKETRGTLSPLETIARTIYDEARGEGFEGMKAVSDVILNSTDGTPESLKKQCLYPYRYSGWNGGKLLQKGTGQSWEISKRLASEVLSPTTKPNKEGHAFFCNPQMILKHNGIKNVPSLLTPEDLVALPDSYLKYLPTFMFYPVKKDLGKGAWKHVYPKTKQNLRKDFDTIGKQLFYTKA